jgi:predicted TIM-barrel fold metal-dependent hydrolase
MPERAPWIVDGWVVPNPPEVASGWPPHLAHVFHQFGRSDALAGIPASGVVAEMDEAGIEIAVLTGLVEADFTISNDVVGDWIRLYPERFRGRACVDPRKPAAAVAELQRCVVELGFGSLQLLPYAFGFPFDDRLYYPLFAKCVELGIPVVTQVGHTASLLPSDPGRPIYLDQVALDFPELTIVGGHIGWPWTEEMIALAWKHPNVYIDTSAHIPHRYPASFVDFLKNGGAEKTLFATDHPWLRMDRTVAGVDKLGLDDAAKEAFLSGTARQIFTLPPAPVALPEEVAA